MNLLARGILSKGLGLDTLDDEALADGNGNQLQFLLSRVGGTGGTALEMRRQERVVVGGIIKKLNELVEILRAQDEDFSEEFENRFARFFTDGSPNIHSIRPFLQKLIGVSWESFIEEQQKDNKLEILKRMIICVQQFNDNLRREELARLREEELKIHTLKENFKFFFFLRYGDTKIYDCVFLEVARRFSTTLHWPENLCSPKLTERMIEKLTLVWNNILRLIYLNCICIAFQLKEKPTPDDFPHEITELPLTFHPLIDDRRKRLEACIRTACDRGSHPEIFTILSFDDMMMTTISSEDLDLLNTTELFLKVGTTAAIEDELRNELKWMTKHIVAPALLSLRGNNEFKEWVESEFVTPNLQKPYHKIDISSLHVWGVQEEGTRKRGRGFQMTDEQHECVARYYNETGLGYWKEASNSNPCLHNVSATQVRLVCRSLNKKANRLAMEEKQKKGIAKHKFVLTSSPQNN
jgi:hypothetical protein